MSVALVNMPFGSTSRPSLGISLLKAVLTNNEIRCDNYYFNLDFCKIIGEELYKIFATEVDNPEIIISNKLLTGEWLFSNFFYERKEVEKERYLKFLLGKYKKANHSKLLSYLEKITNKVPEFIEQCLNNVDWASYKIVGFSSMFEQTYASLILAKEIKRKYPCVLIGFGGANCESSLGLGLLKTFSFIDFVSKGEAEESFLKLVQNVLNQNNSWKRTEGFAVRNNQIIDNTDAPQVDLNKIPTPNYDEYFNKSQKLNIPEKKGISLLLETSRGCWWGQKHHCTFCALNGTNINYRSKSVKRSIRELETLSKKYNIKYIQLTDNILDKNTLDEILDILIEKESPYFLFLETKSNLKRDFVKKLMKARVYAIQAGIENLSDKTLKIMNKGTKGLSNIALMKFCKTYNVELSWNFIFGFPGESIKEFDWLTKTFENLVHLTPPYSIGPIRLDKFSPNYTHADKKGLIGLKPTESYYYVIDEDKSSIDDMAFYYDFIYEDNRDPKKYSKKLVEIWRKWSENKNPGKLIIKEYSDDEYVIYDTRFTKEKSEIYLEKSQAYIYAYCDNPRNFNSIKSAFSERSVEELEDFLHTMIEKDFMISQNGCYLSLAIISDQILFNLKIESHEQKQSKNLHFHG